MGASTRRTNAAGLASLLGTAGPLRPEPCPTAIPGLDLIPSGPHPPNPSDLLDSQRFGDLLEELLRRDYDHIIFDSPPVLAVADPAIIGSRVEGTLVVIRAGVTEKEALEHTMERLQQVNARPLGAVMNQVDGRTRAYYGYKYLPYGQETEPRHLATVTRLHRRTDGSQRTP